MEYSYLLVLVIGASILAAVKSEDVKIIQNEDPYDLSEGYSYERFNFLTEFIADGRNVNDTLYWNSCSNYTGIDLFLNETESQDCIGKVISCSDNYNGHRLSKRQTVSLVNSIQSLLETEKRYETHGSCHCLCNRVYDRKPEYPLRELLDSICLDEVSADVDNNYVLTGVRLNRLNNTIVFEIQEGQLRDGIILPHTIRWVPPSKKCNRVGLMTVSKRTLVLDDVIFSDDNIVVTGVAFTRYSDILEYENIYPESPENIEKDPFFLTIIGHELNSDYRLQLNISIEHSVWDYSLQNRSNLINSDMEISIALMEPHHNHVLSKPNENYVTFDFALPQYGLHQFIIPYIDSQNVTDTVYPQYVKGIGLQYRGFEGYGGYVEPTIFVPTY